MNKKIENQLNEMLHFVQRNKLTSDEKREISKIGFLYSINRMSPLEVALRLWYVANHNVDGIYEEAFQKFMNETCRKVVK